VTELGSFLVSAPKRYHQINHPGVFRLRHDRFMYLAGRNLPTVWQLDNPESSGWWSPREYNIPLENGHHVSLQGPDKNAESRNTWCAVLCSRDFAPNEPLPVELTHWCSDEADALRVILLWSELPSVGKSGDEH